MKLTKVRITEFQSIQDSTDFEVGDVTCLVGKNEAGKTAVLKALYRLNPIVKSDFGFDVTRDYPRRDLSDYEDDIQAGRREPSDVVEATYELESADIEEIQKIYGPECLREELPTLTLRKGYSSGMNMNIDMRVDSEAVVKHLVHSADLPQQLADRVRELDTVEKMAEVLGKAEQTEAVSKLRVLLQEISGQELSNVIYKKFLASRIPKFLYFDEFYQMKGQDNLDALSHRNAKNALEGADHPLLGLIDLAGLDLDQLVAPRQTAALIARLEAAGNRLTDKVLRYWSQNKHLQMKFDIRQALPEDPAGMTEGTNIWGLVHDTKHLVSTGLGTRSRGFIWFFSFLSWYSHLRKRENNIILLLDEPGLSLHAKAQADLLRYFEEELKPHHQLIYTTHSPFMVDPTHFDRVRIVQDPSLEEGSEDLPEDQQGTKVITEVLDATPDSLFPLQGALGYERFSNALRRPKLLGCRRRL